MIRYFILTIIFFQLITTLGASNLTDDKTKGQKIEIRLDPRSEGRVFEGIGTLSAGASSALLIDYPEPYRSEILDFLFSPKLGIGFQHLKVEIGSGMNSTCG
ncbi:MAG: hypothetical protein ABFS16_12105, partial [Bacteroidota bacterium]